MLKLTQILEEMQILCLIEPFNAPSDPAAADPSVIVSEATSQGSKRAASEKLSDEELRPSKRSTRNRTASVEDSEDSDEEEDEPSLAARTTHKSKRQTILISDEESDPETTAKPSGKGASRVFLYLTIRAADQRRARKSSKPRNPRSDPTVLGDDGMLADIEVQPLRDISDKKDPTADVKQFFGDPYLAKGKRGPELKLHPSLSP
ncbi:hypothetical protein B0H10DRAFT_1945014 [Mycena sp. CBHHK59/15]|nr:hypothetical protein B0H10DRAFT_1945014 [Mycena sp. CBHHK59/15]